MHTLGQSLAKGISYGLVTLVSNSGARSFLFFARGTAVQFALYAHMTSRSGGTQASDRTSASLLCLWVQWVGSGALGNPSVSHSMNYTIIGAKSEMDQTLESRVAFQHGHTEDVNGIGPTAVAREMGTQGEDPTEKYAQCERSVWYERGKWAGSPTTTGHQWREIFIVGHWAHVHIHRLWQ